MAFVVPDSFVLMQTAVLARDDLTTWSRLEPLPDSADLAPSLQAQIADPLWLLLRQWQFGELRGEDAGTPIDARLAGERMFVSRYAPGGVNDDLASRAVDYRELTAPLEACIEREPVRPQHARLAADAGLHFLDLLTAEGVASLRPLYRSHPGYAFDPLAVEDPAADTAGAAWQVLLAGRGPDGRKLAADLRPLRATDGTLGALPAAPAVPAGDQDAVKRAAGRWLAWYDSLVSEPSGEAAAWNPQRLEYAHVVSAESNRGPVVLRADEYTDGRLDWYDFDVADGPALGSPAEPAPAETLELGPMIPKPARYPGMPVDRFWEFEDARVSFGALDAGPTDLARLLVIEFALVYGNDWFVVPVELPVGSLFSVTSLVVRDTFGVAAEVGPARNRDGSPWTLFEPSLVPGAPDRLRGLFFLPPVVAGRLESDPLEEVALFRDEMANTAWGVERTVQGAAGLPRDRRLERRDEAVAPPVAAADAPPLTYRLATSVPRNWIPFVPVPATASPVVSQFAIRLERRAMLRRLPDGALVPVHPDGRILRVDPSVAAGSDPPLLLEEEEVPREGIVVERSFQYARWLGGSAFRWAGRRKRVGKGEGASGLRFDTADRRS